MLDTAGPDAAKRFHDLLFEHQPEEGSAGLSDGQLLDYAVNAGARRSKVSGLISDRAFENWVEKGTSQASEDGVSSHADGEDQRQDRRSSRRPPSSSSASTKRRSDPVPVTP